MSLRCSGFIALSKTLHSVLNILVCSLLYVQSQSTPLQATNVNSTSIGFKLPLNTTSITVPASPPGFVVYWHIEPTEPLNVLAIYLSAIDCMYQFAQKGWDTTLEGGIRTWAQGSTVEVDIEGSQRSGGPSPFLTSHIILGLYYTMVEISKSQMFCKVTASLWIEKIQRGTLKIQEWASGMSSVETANTGLTNATTGDLSAHPSGRAVDFDDPRFTIDYAYDGARIASQDIFIAVLDGLATSAQYADDTKFQHLTATSASGKCQINITEVAGPHQSNYSFVIKALRMLTFYVILRLRTFGEMNFDLKWEGMSIAQGSMRAVDTVFNDGPQGIDIARRDARALPGP